MKIEKLALPTLRFGIVILFLWFGLSQITAPTNWTGWVPEWATSFGLSANVIVLLNGSFETILGLVIALGFYTRLAALLLALHIFLISFEIGYTAIGVRDFVLAIATLSLAMFKPDHYTFDNRSKNV